MKAKEIDRRVVKSIYDLNKVTTVAKKNPINFITGLVQTPEQLHTYLALNANKFTLLRRVLKLPKINYLSCVVGYSRYQITKDSNGLFSLSWMCAEKNRPDLAPFTYLKENTSLFDFIDLPLTGLADLGENVIKTMVKMLDEIVDDFKLPVAQRPERNPDEPILIRISIELTQESQKQDTTAHVFILKDKEDVYYSSPDLLPEEFFALTEAYAKQFNLAESAYYDF